MSKDTALALQCASPQKDILLVKKLLEYRYRMLGAVLDETHKSLKILLDVDELNDENNPLVNYADTELPLFINNLSSSLLDFIQTDIDYANESADSKKKLCKKLRFQSSVIRNLKRYIKLQIAAAVATLNEMEQSSLN
jgi:hypothetical protein